MKLNIARAFSKKKQISRFEPIDAFCYAAMELELPETDQTTLKTVMEDISGNLDKFVQNEVTKTMAPFVLKDVETKDKKSRKAEIKEQAEVDAIQTHSHVEELDEAQH